MNLTTKNISVSKTARYFMLGEPSEKINSVWIVLHGFGQLAEEFIKYFKTVSNETTIIIAPEALNKFYLKGFSGKVGATWMTKEDRENETNDYVNYLDAVYDDVIKHGLFSHAKITVLGFSQGTVTACRWITKGKSKIDRLILWGGGIPPDVDLQSSRALFNLLNLTIVIGDKDEFVAEEQIKKEIERLDENKLIYSLKRFTGGHEIRKEILHEIL